MQITTPGSTGNQLPLCRNMKGNGSLPKGHIGSNDKIWCILHKSSTGKKGKLQYGQCHIGLNAMHWNFGYNI